nr:hypothetical protein CFP56_34856 [Quercus suber]
MCLLRSVRDPSRLQEALMGLCEPDLHLTLHIYAPLEGKYSPDAHQFDESFGLRLLEPLWVDWIQAIRRLPSTLGTKLTNSNVKVILDLTRFAIKWPNTTNLTTHEARGTMRVTALLHQRLRHSAHLQAVIIGLPCWCLLRQCEKHIVLPKGMSWPLSRSSHAPPSQSKSGEGAQCHQLATEHWDDEHWV